MEGTQPALHFFPSFLFFNYFYFYFFKGRVATFISVPLSLLFWFFFFWPHWQHMEVAVSGIKPVPHSNNQSHSSENAGALTC